MNRRLDDLERVEVANAEDLREWLAAHHAAKSSYWLVTGKKAAGERYLPYDAIVETLLCYGWVDSLPRSLDGLRTMTLISPRKEGSNWSRDNRKRIARLEKAGGMTAPGKAVVARAKRDGSWDRLKQTESGQPPEDLAAALDKARARANWDNFSLSVRRRALEFLLAAKRPQTRADRIEKIASASAAGVDPTQWSPKA